jgi:hypothetical protein
MARLQTKAKVACKPKQRYLHLGSFQLIQLDSAIYINVKGPGDSVLTFKLVPNF